MNWPSLDDVKWAPRCASLAEITEMYIDGVLDRTNGNVSQAAQLLGIHRSALQRKLKKRRGRI